MSKRNQQKHRIMKQMSMDLWGLFKRLKYNVRPGQHGSRKKFYDNRRVYKTGNKFITAFGYDRYSVIRRFKKFYLNVSDRQMRNIHNNPKYMDIMTNTVGFKETNVIWERRLDMIVYRLGWASSPMQSRHFISHGYFLVNGIINSRSSHLLQIGDIITVDSKRYNMIRLLLQNRINSSHPLIGVPKYIEVDFRTLNAIIFTTIEPQDIAYPTK